MAKKCILVMIIICTKFIDFILLNKILILVTMLYEASNDYFKTENCLLTL